MGNQSSAKKPDYVQPLVLHEKPKNEKPPAPWRNMGRFKLDVEMENELKKQINDFATDQEDTKFRLLLLGAVGAGKSSFINSIATIDKGRLANVSHVGTANKSKTTKLREYSTSKLIKNAILLDTMGIEVAMQEGFNIEDAVYLIKGNIPLDYQFNPRCPVNPETCKDFNKNPEEGDKSHCVAFVVDIQVVIEDNIAVETKRKLTQLQEKMDDLNVSTVLLLTHVDTICPDIAKTFYNVKVGKAVKMASEIFGIPELFIFPVKNYSDEGALNPIKNVLLLLALKQMMHFAADSLEMNSYHSKGKSAAIVRSVNTGAKKPKDVTEQKEAIKQMPYRLESRENHTEQTFQRKGNCKVTQFSAIQKPKDTGVEKLTEATERMIIRPERTENDICDSLNVGQNVSARIKAPMGMSETWQDGYIKEILFDGALYNIDFGDGNTKYLKIKDIRPK